jgi:hypothetical protein
VRKDGDTIHVAVDCPCSAPPRRVGGDDDYDNMARFISNLTESSVRMHMGNRMQVSQKGKASRGPLSISFENMREIQLVPKTEIRSKLIAGDTMPAAFVTRIEERDGVTHVMHTGLYTPSMWVPPGIGPAMIEAETRSSTARSGGDPAPCAVPLASRRLRRRRVVRGARVAARRTGRRCARRARPPRPSSTRRLRDALAAWHSAEDVNAWIGARFEYDTARAMRLSETQRQASGRLPIHRRRVLCRAQGRLRRPVALRGRDAGEDRAGARVRAT